MIAHRLSAAALLVSLASCGRAAPDPRAAPDAPACAPIGEASPIAVSIGRDELGRAIDNGLAIVAYDCHGLRALPSCHARGTYGTIGIVPRRETIELTSRADVAMNVVGEREALGEGASFTLHVGALLVASRSSVEAAALEGACAGATHVVREIEVGVVAPKGQEAKVCWSGDGLTDATEVKKCSTVLRLHLRPIGPAPEPDVERVTPPVACPAGAVAAGHRCLPAAAAPRHRCAFGDAADCRAQCAAGDSGSCAVLGWMRARGRGIEKDPREAVELLRRGCDGGDRHACANLVAAVSAHPQPQPNVDASDLYFRSCARGDAEACFVLGDALSPDDPKQAELAVTVYSRACQGGAAGACVTLGARLHARAEHVPAKHLFERACDAGDPFGCVNLGLMARDGEGAPANVARAFRLLDDGCRAGAAVGCAHAAEMLRAGQGVEQDFRRAAELFELGCRGKLAGACRARGQMREQAFGAPRDVLGAAQDYERGCTLGDASSCNERGRLHLLGDGAARDERAAAALFRRACDGGEPVACLNLAQMHEAGGGVEKSPARARELHEKACKGGVERSCKALGRR